MSNTDCRDKFRFDHAGIKRVVVLLRIPAVLITPKHGERFSALKGKFMLSYPRKLNDLQSRHDRFKAPICRVTIFMIHHLLCVIQQHIL
ncbi:hypothetical protein JG688_00005550 [Phytophthora aleatoria]|uniref:Uncharacterized protein n=1 Tax=Phytophthora aleatoria TaxID=2496075 RepID=A0A8J5MAG4_9STRA|nr:hypothetical protein JG688_00005550 [Phytophthora aleatoria]